MKSKYTHLYQEINRSLVSSQLFSKKNNFPFLIFEESKIIILLAIMLPQSSGRTQLILQFRMYTHYF